VDSGRTHVLWRKDERAKEAQLMCLFRANHEAGHGLVGQLEVTWVEKNLGSSCF
jgi:hypothetical protein